MTDKKENSPKKTLSLKASSDKLELLKKKSAQNQAKPSVAQSKKVMVELKPKKRSLGDDNKIALQTVSKSSDASPAAKETKKKISIEKDDSGLTNAEKEARAKALKLAMDSGAEEKRIEEMQKLEEEATKRKVEQEEKKKQAALEKKKKAEEKKQEKPEPKVEEAPSVKEFLKEEKPKAEDSKEEKQITIEELQKHIKKTKNVVDSDPSKNAAKAKHDSKRRSGKLTIAQALDDEYDERQRSLASLKRAREKEKQRLAEQQQSKPRKKQVREVIIPDTITVQELANRMAEKGTEIIKSLMKMGVMATINQTIDSDTAELVVEEFGHTVKRVSESDVELGLGGEEDKASDLQSRSPVVTVMGHVDHGKTSLLDAMRHADVVSSEAGGITQHIGAYQITTESGNVITFLDTPGHEAFTEMRARGTNVTDIVVLVVAADDNIQPQTIEAIAHAKAAGVPIIVAINKIDKPESNPDKVRTGLLSHELQVESLGGDVLEVAVSAKNKTNLDKLIEAILLQSELLELKANPNRTAQGVVVEASLDKGRGPVVSMLVKRGTLKVGDCFVSGDQYGRVRAMFDDKGKQIKQAGPSVPVEILGANGTPSAGDDFYVVEDDAKAKEITEFRQRRKQNQKIVEMGKSKLEHMFSQLGAGKVLELPLIIKADVQGSVEAIAVSLEKLATDEVKPQIIHTGVGVINETDVSLANASGAMIIGFNVRPTAQARTSAQDDNVDIRYYSIIYDLIEEAKRIMGGMLSPIIEEVFVGRAEIRQIFSVSKIGRIAGCRVVEGVIKRDQKINLVRDGIVVHEGKIKTLKHVQKDVSEIKEGFECGITIENYQDIHEGDVIECYELNEKEREL